MFNAHWEFWKSWNWFCFNMCENPWLFSCIVMWWKQLWARTLSEFPLGAVPWKKVAFLKLFCTVLLWFSVFGRTQRASVNKPKLCLLLCTTIFHRKIDVCFIHCSLKQIPSDFKGSAFLNSVIVKFIFIQKYTLYQKNFFFFFIIPDNLMISIDFVVYQRVDYMQLSLLLLILMAGLQSIQRGWWKVLKREIKA